MQRMLMASPLDSEVAVFLIQRPQPTDQELINFFRRYTPDRWDEVQQALWAAREATDFAVRVSNALNTLKAQSPSAAAAFSLPTWVLPVALGALALLLILKKRS